MLLVHLFRTVRRDPSIDKSLQPGPQAASGSLEQRENTSLVGDLRHPLVEDDVVCTLSAQERAENEVGDCADMIGGVDRAGWMSDAEAVQGCRAIVNACLAEQQRGIGWLPVTREERPRRARAWPKEGLLIVPVARSTVGGEIEGDDAAKVLRRAGRRNRERAHGAIIAYRERAVMPETASETFQGAAV